MHRSFLLIFALFLLKSGTRGGGCTCARLLLHCAGVNICITLLGGAFGSGWVGLVLVLFESGRARVFPFLSSSRREGRLSRHMVMDDSYCPCLLCCLLLLCGICDACFERSTCILLADCRASTGLVSVPLPYVYATRGLVAKKCASAPFAFAARPTPQCRRWHCCEGTHSAPEIRRAWRRFSP